MITQQQANMLALRGQVPTPGQPTPVSAPNPWETLRQNYAQQAAEARARYNALNAQQPDYEALKAEARARGERGGRQLMLSLAAANAGKRFGGFSGELFQRAMAARDPTKVAGGQITSEGQFIEDPMYKREQLLKLAQDDAQRYDTLVQQSLQQEGLALDRDEARKSREQLAREANASRAEIAKAREEDRAEARRVAAEGRTERRQDQFARQSVEIEGKLRDDFRQATTALAAEKDAYTRAGPLLNRDPKTWSTSDFDALLYIYNKFMDPTSVVREGEYARTTNLSSLVDQARMQIARVVNEKQLLTPEIARQIVGTMTEIMKASNERGYELSDQYKRITDDYQKRGFDVHADNIVPERMRRPKGAPPLGVTVGAPSGGGNKGGAVVGAPQRALPRATAPAAPKTGGRPKGRVIRVEP